MGGLKGHQGRAFPLEGLVEVVGGRKRTRRLNRRKDRHLGLRIIAVGQGHTLRARGRKAAVSHRNSVLGEYKAPVRC